MDRGHAGVGLGGDNREVAAGLDGGEQEHAGSGEAEAVLVAHGPADPPAQDPLGGVRLFLALMKEGRDWSPEPPERHRPGHLGR